MAGQMRFATRHRRAHSPVMKLRLIAIVLVAATAGCSTPPATEPARKPGFLERAWVSGKKGSRSVLDSTLSGAGSGWRATKDLVASPFSKSKKKSSSATAQGKELNTEIKLKPEPVRLGVARSIEVVVVITNNGARSMQLDFPTSQHIELVMKSEGGAVVQRWSDDQQIGREASFVVVNPGERLEYTTNLSTRNMSTGKTYIIEATVPGYPAISAKKIVVPQ